ncbi:hypothetical protein AVEN_48740-1 [Araneus ventricosus]|uniref:Uncharacterized protein n=1 Tax=Araneus ventricosus TaxID=182803 RepID=A0A4Y2IW13_ARAVE|nr:hypothetical protein AVEN_48740-1 [Araneus ventricosus]
MKPTISFKFPDGSDEQHKDSDGRSSHLERNKGPGSDLPSLLDNAPRYVFSDVIFTTVDILKEGMDSYAAEMGCGI